MKLSLGSLGEQVANLQTGDDRQTRRGEWSGGVPVTALTRLPSGLVRLTWASDDIETRVADLQRMISACQVFDGAIERVAWPAATGPPMMLLARGIAGYAAALERWGQVGAPLQGSAFETVQNTDLGRVGAAAEATLGLPPA
jgi:hypothetical protein